MAYTDLGGLGAKQGVPVFYDWVPPSPMPQVLPWLAILGLLMLKPNRRASAWWIWIPLACVAGVTALPAWLLALLRTSEAEYFLEMIGAASFGVAAVWLLASYVAWKHRALAFLGMVLAQGVFSLLAVALRFAGDGGGFETVGLGVFVAMGGAIICLALTLAGLVCRGRYSWLRLSLWLIVMLGGLWMLLLAPFFIVGTVAGGQGFSLLPLFSLVLAFTTMTFGVMLPFLVLCFANGFYRERLKGLLHLGSAAPPPIISPPIPAAQPMASG